MSGGAGEGTAPGAGARTGPRGTPVPVEPPAASHAWAPIAVLLAGPVVWSVHFVVVYLVVEAGCTGAGPGLAVFAPPVPTIVTLVATAVAALGCGVTAAWGFRVWRAAGHPRAASDSARPGELHASLGFAGFVLSLLGVVQILLVGLPALVLPAC